MGYNQREYRFYVVNASAGTIDSGWENRLDAMERTVALKNEGATNVKVMTRPRVWDRDLDPNDDANWTTVSRSNPARWPPPPGGYTRWCPRCGAAAHSMRTKEQREKCATLEAALKKYGRTTTRTNPGKKYSGSTSPRRGSGYTECACPDCFDISISDDMRAPELCAECEEAGCDGDGECRRTDAYGVDEGNLENPPSVVKTKRDERLWKMAKKSAAEQGREGDWAYVMGIFQRMKQRVGGGARENPGSKVTGDEQVGDSVRWTDNEGREREGTVVKVKHDYAGQMTMQVQDSEGHLFWIGGLARRNPGSKVTGDEQVGDSVRWTDNEGREREGTVVKVKHGYAGQMTMQVQDSEGHLFWIGGLARRNPGYSYVTTFCNWPHRLSDGKPIGHNCYVLDPVKLRLEAEGRISEIEGSIVKEPRREMRRGTRENPGELLVVNPTSDTSTTSTSSPTRRAERVYKMWHQKDPHNAFTLKTGCRDDDAMVCVGHAHNIVYRSGKWEKGRKTNDYIHHFDSKPKVWMVAHLVGSEDQVGTAEKDVGTLMRALQNGDGRYEVAELAAPISLGLDDGTTEGSDIKIHAGSKVYGGVDRKTVIIFDPHWKLIVIKGGKMHFDERGIVK